MKQSEKKESNTIEINTRVDGRRNWVGVVLTEKQVSQMKIFLEKLSPKG